MRKSLIGNKMGILAAACLGIWMILPVENVSNAFCVSLIPLILFFLVYWRAKIDLKKLISCCDKADRIWAGCFTLLFLIMLPVTALYKAHITDILILKIVICILYTIILSGCVFVDFMVLFCWNRETALAEGGGRTEAGSQSYKGCLFLITAVSLAFMVSCYPGLLHGDGWNMWRMAVSLWGWTDWHPVGFLLFCRMLSYIWNNPYIVIIGQTGIWIYVNWCILSALGKYRGKTACRLYTAAALFVVNSFYSLVALNKDGVFASCFLGFTVSLILCLKDEKARRPLIQMAVFGVCAALFRHMMIVPVMSGILTAAAYWLCRKRRKAFFSTVLTAFVVCISYVAIRYVVFQVKDVKENPPYVKYTVALQMMGAYASYGDVDPKSEEFMEQYLPVERWAEVYEEDPYFADRISRALYGNFSEAQLIDLGKHGTDIIKINARFLAKEPLAYLRAFFKQNGIVWRMSEPDEYGVRESAGFYNNEVVVAEQNPEWNPVRNYMTELTEPFTKLVMNLPVWKYITYYSGFAILVILIGVYMAVRRKEWEYVIGAVPTGILVMMLLVSVPAQTSRYVLPVIQIGVLYLALFSHNYQRVIKAPEELRAEGDVRSYRWLLLIFFVYLAGTRIRIGYIGDVLTDTTITFEDADLIQNDADFPEELYYADGGAWFTPEYTIGLPYRIQEDIWFQFEGYCCSDDNRIEVYVNGEYVGVMEKEDPELNMTTYFCRIPQEYFSGRSQTIFLKADHSILLNGVDAMGDEKNDFMASFYMTKLNLILEEQGE